MAVAVIVLLPSPVIVRVFAAVVWSVKPVPLMLNTLVPVVATETASTTAVETPVEVMVKSAVLTTDPEAADPVELPALFTESFAVSVVAARSVVRYYSERKIPNYAALA